ncbi:MAG: hypothetical protein M3Q97_03950, partial [Bacteroidota bacterium]|nr:hypothetical protein [Bacteroidota bacterium]
MKIFNIHSKSESPHDRQLREKLEAHEVTPPSALWENIEEKLPSETRRRKLLWFILMPIAACLLGAFVTFAILTNEKLSPEETSEKISRPADRPNSITKKQAENVSGGENIEDSYTATESRNIELTESSAFEITNTPGKESNPLISPNTEKVNKEQAPLTVDNVPKMSFDPLIDSSTPTNESFAHKENKAHEQRLELIEKPVIKDDTTKGLSPLVEPVKKRSPLFAAGGWSMTIDYNPGASYRNLLTRNTYT